MSSVKENIIKIKVLAALIEVNFLKNNWRSMNWRLYIQMLAVMETKSTSPNMVFKLDSILECSLNMLLKVAGKCLSLWQHNHNHGYFLYKMSKWGWVNCGNRQHLLSTYPGLKSSFRCLNGVHVSLASEASLSALEFFFHKFDIAVMVQ